MTPNLACMVGGHARTKSSFGLMMGYKMADLLANQFLTKFKLSEVQFTVAYGLETQWTHQSQHPYVLQVWCC